MNTTHQNKISKIEEILNFCFVGIQKFFQFLSCMGVDCKTNYASFLEISQIFDFEEFTIYSLLKRRIFVTKNECYCFFLKYFPFPFFFQILFIFNERSKIRWLFWFIFETIRKNCGYDCGFLFLSETIHKHFILLEITIFKKMKK